jgi:peptidoglycan/xylan/chitin deacetylase (PgdA/CDA1 family)
MPDPRAHLARRQFLLGCAAALAADPLRAADDRPDPAADDHKALVAITLDLEMSRNFPTWETTHWDYEKGNLNAETKQYTVEACRRVKAHSGVLHCFCVGRVLEQENVDWLKQIVQAGHPVGNHTYDHVNVLATRPEDIQFRFRRAPWLISGQQPRDVIRDNIRLTTAALKTRIGIDPAGFRTPGGFADGLAGRPDVQRLLLDQGFEWVSSKYPAYPVGKVGRQPGAVVLDAIVRAQAAAQPFVYPSGLVEVPMNPVSDISAFRGGRWKLDWFLQAVRRGVEWAIEHHAVYDFLGHPSCLYVTDPHFRAIEMICDLVRRARHWACLVDLGTVARRAKLRHKNGAKERRG